MYYLNGNSTEQAPEGFDLPFGQHGLEYKYRNIDDYETIAEQREVTAFYLVVADGEYHSLFFWSIIKLC